MMRSFYLTLAITFLFVFLGCSFPPEKHDIVHDDIVTFEVKFTRSEDDLVALIENAIPYPLPEYEDTADHKNSLSADDGGLLTGTIAQEVLGEEKVTPPASTSGKLFFYQNGKPYVCSGNIVGNLDVVVTAGHCVFADGVASTDIIFRPLYDYPLGRYKAAEAHTSLFWRNRAYRNDDFAVIKLQFPILRGTGALGWWVNQPHNDSLPLTAYGYPASPPFDGRKLFKVDGKGVIINRAPSIYMKNNDMTGGSSGGAWVHKGLLVGLNAYTLSGNKNYMYSPKLEGSFCRALNKAEVKCP